LSAVVSNDAINRVEHLVEYLSCRVFGQAMYRHVIFKYTFIKFVTFYSKGLPVGWSRGARGGGGRGRVPLGRRAPLGGKVPLGRRVAF